MLNTKKKILVIEDNPHMRENISEILELADYQVFSAENGKVGVEMAQKFIPDIIICDIMMPELNGYGVLHLLGKKDSTSRIPFIFLTAKTDRDDLRKGMNLGADDYITKPFSQRLLGQRIKAVLRRAKLTSTTEPMPEEGDDKVIRRGKLVLDSNRHACSWDGQSVRLTVTEFLILEALAKRPGYVKSRDQLMDAAYDDQIYVDDRTIDSHIKRLRKKFRKTDKSFDAIETLYGVGYKYKES